jgi:aconitate hydratase
VTAATQEFVRPEMFKQRYADVFTGTESWQKIKVTESERYEWRENSTYIRQAPFFEGLGNGNVKIRPLTGMQVLALFGDSVTTDHISPAGQIAPDSPAAAYLTEKGIARKDWNSYGSRRGNDQVMCRGTFANIRIRNLLVPESEGNVTRYHPSGEQMTFFDAAMQYKDASIPLCILAGKEYGSGSSRDWAAKGPYLLGVRAVIAESYERIHRSNLIGMGILPLQSTDGESVASIGLNGTEVFSIGISDNMVPQQEVSVSATAVNGDEINFKAVSRIDTPVEIEYYRDGGILRTVLKKLLFSSS